MSTPTDKAPTAFRFGGFDLLLLFLGVLGLVGYALLLPAQHPDSSAVYEIDEGEAINRANVFLSGQGYSIDGLFIEGTLVRNQTLLQDLQKTLGRDTSVEFLNSENRNQLAAYYWKIRYEMPPSGDGGSFFNERQDLFIVHLAQGGGVLAFLNFSAERGAAAIRYGSSLDRINRSSLSTIIRADSATNAQARTELLNIPDSAMVARLSFDLYQTKIESNESLLNTLLRGENVRLDSTRILELLDYHLDRTVFSDVAFKVDSIRIETGNRSRVARVRLVSDPPIAGQQIVLDASLPVTGTLSRLDITFNPDRDTEPEVRSVLRMVQVGLYALLSFVFIVVFFRRLIARLLDMKSALVDSMILGIMAGVVVIMAWADLSNALIGTPLWANILIRLATFSVVAASIAIFAFMTSGVTDSVVRESYVGKLGTLILLRHGDFQNRPMGASLTRGISIGLFMLGLATLFLVLFPELSLSMPETLLRETSFRPVLSVSFDAFESAYFSSILWVVGIGTISHRWSSSSVLAVILVTISGALLQVGPLTLDYGYLSLGISGVFALILALTFIRYDILTVMVALFSSSLVWSLSEGFLIEGSEAWIDLLLGSFFIGSLVLLGFVGTRSKRTGQQVNTYVPEYVTEMAGQARVKRELEIAHQVQSFFLPRTMPQVEGLEIAGMCLSANEVGGDYYDFITLEDRSLAFVLGDVSGKGIQAAFFMTLVKGIVQTLARLKIGPAEVMRRLNHLFCQNAPAGTFISVIYGVVDPVNMKFTFARAGHNPAILYRAGDQKSEALRPRGMAIGFSDGAKFDDNIDEVVVDLKKGDTLVFYTDGFSEAMNRSRDLYGDDRLVEKVGQIGDRSASAILRMMTEDVHHFIEGMGRADDMTMAVLKLI